MAEMIKTRMTAKEFLELPESNLPTELIDGEVIMSPAPEPAHQRASRAIFRVLDKIVSGGEIVYAPADVLLGEDVVQPDLFWISEGGDCKTVDDNKYWQGAPDLVIEILSPSTTSDDRGVKYDLYEKHGVREYWLVDPGAKCIEVYVLKEGKFMRQGLFEPGTSFTSPVLEGQSVDVGKLFEY